jgi:hypothetical protein
MLLPDTVRVPAPTLMRLPGPEIVPPSVASLRFVSIVPTPFKVIARLLVNVESNPDAICKVPKLKARPPELLPRLLSVDTASVPPLIAVPPEYVLLPDKVSVPSPILARAPGPAIVPASVASLPLVSTVPPPAVRRQGIGRPGLQCAA